MQEVRYAEFCFSRLLHTQQKQDQDIMADFKKKVDIFCWGQGPVYILQHKAELKCMLAL